MKRSNNAFTLTELLVALGVIAILCAILLPVIFNLMPNQNTVMAKRAYYTVQSVVAELIDDEACYPDKTSAVNNPTIGFDDAAGTPNCKLWGEDHKEDSGATQAQTKFKTLFLDKLGIEGSEDKFETSDGIKWAFTDASFVSSDKEGGSIKLTVDVNGSDKPNCAHKGADYSKELEDGGGDACKEKETGFDRFQMTIKGNGQIVINENDVWAINAVKVNRNITSDKNSNEDDD